MPVVKDLGMTQSVRRRAVKVLFSFETRKKSFIQRPGIVKVLLGSLAGYVTEIGERERANLAVRVGACQVCS